MQTYEIARELVDYRGAGKAWAAVADGRVVALRYMDAAPLDWPDKPAWVAAVEQTAAGLDESLLPVAHGSQTLARVAQAAQACEDCPTPPRRSRYRPAELLTMARAALAAAHQAAFAAHRTRCREELSLLGEVRSGLCSCYEFVCR